MMKKFGVNSTRAEKRGPVVKKGIGFQKLVTCSCGKKFMKSCSDQGLCEATAHTCPYCGAMLI